jgi:nicotinamide mononucleotide adenylyltransferase
MNDLSKITGTLTAEQTRIADALGKYASTTLAEWGNEASMAVYGYRKFTEDHYWPIRSDPSYTKSESGKGVDVTIKGRGFTKQTVQHANNAIMIGDALDTFAQHVNDMATYSSWLAAIEDAERLKNFRYRNDEGDTVGSVKETITRVLGSAGTKYLALLIEDINQGVKTKHDSFTLSRFTANYKAAAVGANLRVIVQQPTAILRAAAVIDPKYLAAGALRKSNWERVKKWAPIAQWKDWGYFELDNGRLIKDIILGTDSALDRVRQAAMTPAGKADSITWGKIWTACEAEILATHKELKEGTDEFYSAVAKRFNEVIDRSQVVDGILQRIQTMRSSSDLVRMATSFMSEPVTSFSMLSSALYETTHAKDERARTRARKRLARTLAAVLMADILCAAVASLIDALRDDDKEKDYWEKYVEALTGITGDEETFADYIASVFSGNLGEQVNIIAKIPFAKDVFSLFRGYSITRMDMESVSKLIQSSRRMLKALSGEGTATTGAAFADLIASAARIVGLPVANVKRDLLVITNTTLSAIGNWELMYKADKLLYSVDSSDNKGHYYDIAFYAWQEEDKTQYNAICADLISHGYTQKDIDNAIRTRLKKTEQFTGATGERLDGITADLERSSGFKGLPADYQTKALEAASDYATATTMREQNEDYELPSTYLWIDKADAGASVGIETWEYILFRTALQMADDDGSLKQEEVIDALEGMSWLSDEERDYLFGTRYESDKNNPWA